MSPLAFLQAPVRWLRGDLALPRDDQRRAELRLRPVRRGRSPTADAGRARPRAAGHVAFNGAEPVRARDPRRASPTAFAPARLPARRVLPLLRAGRGDAARHRRRDGRGDRSRCSFDAEALERRTASSSCRRRARRAAAGRLRPRLAGAGRRDRRPGDRRALRARARSARSGSAAPSVAARLLGAAGGDRARRFGARARPTGEGPFLRTGDLGFLHGGELFVTGRSRT